jgi:hypothetical protein
MPKPERGFSHFMSNDLQNNKNSALKMIAGFMGALAVLIIAAVLGLPLFFSTTVGKKMLIDRVGNRNGFNLEIDTLSLSWFGSQLATGVRLQKPEDQLLVTCEAISTDSSLIRLAFKNDLGHLKLAAPNLQLAKPFHPSAALNKPVLQTAAFAAVPSIKRAMPAIQLPMTGQIVIERGQVRLNPPGVDPIRFDQIEMLLNMMDPDEIALALNCSTTQQQLQGKIALKGSATHLNSNFPKLTIQASVAQLPVQGIDQLASIFSPPLNGLVYASVGSTIDMQCNFTASEGNFDLSLNAKSPQINAQIATQTGSGMISLKNPASFSFNLTPTLFQKIAKFSPSLAALTLIQPTSLQGTLSQFSCPIPSHADDLLKCSFEGKISAPAQMTFSMNAQPLLVNALTLSTSSTSLEQQVTIAFNADLQTQTQIGSIAIAGNIAQPFSKTMSGLLSINAVKLPVDLIGIAADTPVALSPLLGPTVDLSGSLDIKEANPKLQLSWKSQYLSLPSFALSLNNPWTLITPTPFTLELNPQLFNLAKTEPIQGTLQNLVIPTDSIKNTRVDAVLNVGQIALAGAFPLTLSKLLATLKVNTFDQISLELVGEPLNASISGSFRPATSEFVLNKPLSLQYTFDSALMSTIFPKAPQLAKPAALQMSLDPFSLPIFNFDWNKLNLKGQISSPEMILGSQDKMITLQKTSLPFQCDTGAKTAAFQLFSQVTNPSGGAGSIQGQFNLSNFSFEKKGDFDQVAIQGSLDLQNLPSTLLDAFSEQATLSAITGPIFGGRLKLQSSTEKQTVAIKWTSANLNIDSAFTIDNSSIQLQGASNQITWILTPESYKVLDQLITGINNAKIPFEINEASTFSISLTKLSLPVTPKQAIYVLADRIPGIVFDLAKLQLSSTGSNQKLSFFDKTSQDTIQLSNLSFSLNKSGDGGPLIASLDSGVVTQSGTTSSPQSVKNGSISLTGKLAQTLNDAGTFDPSLLTGSFQLKAQQLPSRALDIIARARGRTDFPFTTVFGDMINAVMSLDLKNFGGPVALNINTPMTRVDLEGHLANGALLLNKPLYVQMKITPEISKLVLKEVNPLNLSYVYSQAPVTLEIPADGFYFPLYPLTLAKITIPEATIELGKVACRNEGNVNITLGLLKTKQFDKSGELSLWFAPIDLSVKKGAVAIDRTEILLADTFDICIWGNVDLAQDYVDTVLGLTAQTLSKAFGIKNLPEDYVLTIPMKGPSDNVQINTNKATAKVALLLAWQNTNTAGSSGGSAGAFVGQFLGKIATLPDSKAKVPPAKHPFPWEVGKGTKTPHAPHEKKRQFKANDKPLKQILKMIR